jgi:hypothetical protein
MRPSVNLFTDKLRESKSIAFWAFVCGHRSRLKVLRAVLVQDMASTPRE